MPHAANSVRLRVDGITRATSEVALRHLIETEAQAHIVSIEAGDQSHGHGVWSRFPTGRCEVELQTIVEYFQVLNKLNRIVVDGQAWTLSLVRVRDDGVESDRDETKPMEARKARRAADEAARQKTQDRTTRTPPPESSHDLERRRNVDVRDDRYRDDRAPYDRRDDRRYDDRLRDERRYDDRRGYDVRDDRRYDRRYDDPRDDRRHDDRPYESRYDNRYDSRYDDRRGYDDRRRYDDYADRRDAGRRSPERRPYGARDPRDDRRSPPRAATRPVSPPRAAHRREADIAPVAAVQVDAKRRSRSPSFSSSSSDSDYSSSSYSSRSSSPTSSSASSSSSSGSD